MSSDPSFRFWRCLVIVVAVALAGGVTLPSAGPQETFTSESSIVGADFSSLLEHEAIGYEFTDNGAPAPLERILSANGVNYSRIRLWVDPKPGSGDLASALALATRSKAAGMEILLDLHYSDTWADLDDQELPAAWANLAGKELVATVRSYTERVVKAFADQGTPVTMVQIGNETVNGMLWDEGKIRQDSGENWEGFAGLYKAGAEGARRAAPGAPPRIMVHTATVGDTIALRQFLDGLVEHDMPFDVIGITYYPFWGGSLDQLGQSLNFLAERYDKDIIVVETGYPRTLDDPLEDCPSAVSIAEHLPDRWKHPPDPAGQASYFEDLRDVLRRVPNGHGLGFFVWEPAWLPEVKLAGDACAKYAGLALFDWEGHALPALDHLARQPRSRTVHRSLQRAWQKQKQKTVAEMNEHRPSATNWMRGWTQIGPRPWPPRMCTSTNWPSMAGINRLTAPVLLGFR